MIGIIVIIVGVFFAVVAMLLIGAIAQMRDDIETAKNATRDAAVKSADAARFALLAADRISEKFDPRFRKKNCLACGGTGETTVVEESPLANAIREAMRQGFVDQKADVDEFEVKPPKGTKK